MDKRSRFQSALSIGTGDDEEDAVVLVVGGVALGRRQRYSPIARTKRQLCKATEAANGGGSNSLLCKRKEIGSQGSSCWGENGCLFVVVVHF